jgi:hypothetical protein
VKGALLGRKPEDNMKNNMDFETLGLDEKTTPVSHFLL